MKRKLILSVLALIAAFSPVLVPSFALAQTPETTTTTRQPEEAPLTGALCERIQSRLATRIDTISKVQEVQGTVYDRLLKRIDVIIDNAETKSYDTTQLSDARESVAVAIGQYDKAVTTFTHSLGSSAEASCENPTRYGELISTARTQLKAIRDANVAVRDAFRTEVIPTLKEYKTWLQAERAGEKE